MTNVKWPSIKMYKDVSSIGQYELALKDGLSPKEAMKGIWENSRDNARSPMTWKQWFACRLYDGQTVAAAQRRIRFNQCGKRIAK